MTTDETSTSPLPLLNPQARYLGEILYRAAQLAGWTPEIRQRDDVGRTIVHLGTIPGFPGRRLLVKIVEEVDSTRPAASHATELAAIVPDVCSTLEQLGDDRMKILLGAWLEESDPQGDLARPIQIDGFRFDADAVVRFIRWAAKKAAGEEVDHGRA